MQLLASESQKPYIAKDSRIPWEIGASLNFITTSEDSLGGEELAFTDVMLLRLHALVSLGDYELFAGSDVLPKQPSYTNELVWQGALAGVRASFGTSWSAWLRAQGGPQRWVARLAHRISKPADDATGPILASTQCRFRRPLAYPDRLRVGARTVDIGDDRFTMQYRIVSRTLGEVAADGGGAKTSATDSAISRSSTRSGR